jgi:hypothetical protein
MLRQRLRPQKGFIMPAVIRIRLRAHEPAPWMPAFAGYDRELGPALPPRRGQLICPAGCFAISLSSPPRKNFSLSRLVETGIGRMSPVPQRGVSRSSRTLERDAVDAGALEDERRFRGRPSRVVLTPRRRRQVDGGNSVGDGDKQARSPGRARNKPLKPLRVGTPGDSGCTCGDYARVVYFFPTRGCGCGGHPAFPTPSLFGRMVHAQLGRIAPRDRGVVSEIGCFKIESLAESSPRKPGPNHHGLSEQKPSAAAPKREAAAYGSPLSRERHSDSLENAMLTLH